MRSRSFALLILMSFLVFLLLACGGGGPREGVQTKKVGEVVTVGKGSWKVLNVEKGSQFTKRGGTGVIKAQGIFVLLEIEVKNLASEPVNLTGQELEIIDEDNTTFSFDSQNNNVYLASLGKENLIKGMISPGQSVRGWIIFDVSKDSRGLKLKARDLEITSDKYALIDLGI